MAKEVVQMDYAVMGQASQTFSTSASILDNVSRALTVLYGECAAKAFVNPFVAAALASRITMLKQRTDKLSKVCTEFSNDLKKAVTEHKSGDYKAGTYFSQGIDL